MTAVTVEAIEEALAALPPTAGEVAALFGELGITGQVGAACRCPVANYLAGEFPDASRVIVYTRATVAMYGELDAFALSAKVPQHLFDFIDRFDDEQYPTLIDGRSDVDNLA